MKGGGGDGGSDRDGSGRQAPRAAENGKPLAYLDSGVLVALALGIADMHYDGVVRMCSEAMRSGYQLATSPLAIMETIGVVRRRTAASHKCKQGNSEDLMASDAGVRRAVAHALSVISGMKKQGTLIIVGAEGWSPDLVLLERKMLEHEGRTVHGKRSRTCRHRGIGMHDWFHYAMAKYAGALVICTTDAAFADIVGNDSEFGHIQVWLAGGPAPGRAA